MKKLFATFLLTTLVLTGCSSGGDSSPSDPVDPVDPTDPILESIKVSNPKTEYELNDEFVIPSVIASYSDQSTKDVKELASFDGFDSSHTGEQTIRVTYLDKHDSYTVTISDSQIIEPVTCTGIRVEEPVTEYELGDSFVRPLVLSLIHI